VTGFFDDHQRRTVDAAMARIIPSDDGPGAREAGVTEFVDRYLSGLAFIYAKPDGSGFLELHGRTAAAWHQRVESLRRQYGEGIEDLDRRSRDRFGTAFHELADADQDDVLAELERASGGQEALQEDKAVAADAPGLQEPATETGLDFFQLLVLHARQGFYADPIYGGNRDHVGWKHIGFPGPASMAEVHRGEYDTLPYFAEGAR
jgi:gluconate 2-dehydrogenase gamma chain